MFYTLDMNIKYGICLTTSERDELETLIRTGTSPARRLTHARILLKADRGPDGPAWTQATIAAALDVDERTVRRVCQRLAEDGLEAALDRQKPRVPRLRKLDGAGEARLTMLACSSAPEGYARWTFQLLAEELVRLEIVDDISRETVRTTLKKTS